MISNALKVVRQYHNLNQTQLAAKLDISTSYLSELEAGKKEPTLELLKRYSAVFNVPLSSLVVFSESLDGVHSKSKLHAFLSKKMLKILEWIGDQDEEKPDTERKAIPAR